MTELERRQQEQQKTAQATALTQEREKLLDRRATMWSAIRPVTSRSSSSSITTAATASARWATSKP